MSDERPHDPAEGGVTTEVRDRILLIGLDRPAKMNGYTPQMARQLVDAFERLDEDEALFVELGGLVAPRHLLIVHGVKDGLHHRPTVEKLAANIQEIFQVAGAPNHTAHEWGNNGHRFYPSLMWPFIEKGMAERN